jgi:simple sugar transport system permease protein
VSTGTPDPEVIAEGGAEPGQEEALEASLTSPARLTAYLRRGGVIVPILTTVIAFFAGGVVVLLTGHNPLSTYNAIFKGTGLNWLFPWVGQSARRPRSSSSRRSFRPPR